MITLSLAGLLAFLAGPPMLDFIGMQRLKSINAQMRADFEFARSEAISRNQFIGVSVREVSTEPLTCYVIFASAANPQQFAGLDPTLCDCSRPAGSACTGNMREIRSVQVPRSQGLELRTALQQWKYFAFDPVSGGKSEPPANSFYDTGAEFCVEVTRAARGRLRVGVNVGGHASICTPDNSVPGYPVCTPYGGPGVRNCRNL